MKVISYCRVSTEKQDLDRQKVLAKDFCKVRGYDLVKFIVEKQSGTKGDREGLNELLTLTSADCDLVIVSEIGRITREEEFQTIFVRIDTLRHNGVSVCFMDDPDNIYTPDKPISLVQFIMLAVKAQGAREELIKIRDRMKTGRDSKYKANPMMVTGSQVPFGFEKYSNPDYILGATPKSLLRVNEAERSAIRMCYDMAISGKSCQNIADWLNASGFVHNNNKGRKLWQAAEVSRLLRNRLYLGERTICGVTHQIEPFVSVELFKLASECISQRRCIIAKDVHFNPLKGLLVCGHCGLPMSPHKNQYHKLIYKCLYRTYVGKNPNRELKHCDNNGVPFDTVNELVWENVNGLLQSDAYYGQSQLTIADYKGQLESIDNEINGHRQLFVEVNTEINTLLTQLKTIDNEYLVKVLQEKFEELKAEADKQEGETVRLLSMRDDVTSKMEQLQAETTIDQNMTIYQRAEFYNRVLSKIEWYGVKFKRYGAIVIYFVNGCQLTVAVGCEMEDVYNFAPQLRPKWDDITPHESGYGLYD